MAKPHGRRTSQFKLPQSQPQPSVPSIENNFTGGLKTEFTGLNFPENSCTDTQNCVFSIIGDVSRRLGIDYETNFTNTTIDRTNNAVSTFVWTNAGGAGRTKIYVLQVGGTLYFYKFSSATTASPMSTTKLVSTVNLSTFTSGGPTINNTECQYTSGNGYLFVFNPGITPIYCTYSTVIGVTATSIAVQIRDFQGYPDGLTFNNEPSSLSNAHQYNLLNQGWPLSAVTSFHVALNVYPSNSEQWWTFKNSSQVYDPLNTHANTVIPNSPAPKGAFIYDARNFNRSANTGLPLQDTLTTTTYKTGAWFAGRVWYTGLDASTTSDPFGSYSWSENIYFSQIVTDTSKFGLCYQANDPTGETLFGLLPTDGGVINIQGSGSIYKLFPIQNGLLVFAANGVWFITGSSGIGFIANDYSIVKISGVQSISSTSFVDVNGLPVFWNEEGIYQVAPIQQGSGQKTNEQMGLQVQPMTIGTILSFYNSIPLQSKKFARGDYNPLTYVLKWVYRSTNETDVTSRYQFDSVLNFNTAHKAFYPYKITGTPFVNDVSYIVSPGGSTAPTSTFKYLCSAPGGGSFTFTFAEEKDTSYLDWKSFDSVGVNFTSYFITGYRLKGQAQRKFQPQYIYMYNDIPTYGYTLQGIWDFAISPLSNRYSTVEVVNVNQPGGYFAKALRKHRIRGNGYVLQFKVGSVTGKPFNIAGWSVLDVIGIA